MKEVKEKSRDGNDDSEGDDVCERNIQWVKYLGFRIRKKSMEKENSEEDERK